MSEVDTLAADVTDVELAELWRLSGGTMYSGSREEAGSMPRSKLFALLRRLLSHPGGESRGPLALALTTEELEAFREWKAKPPAPPAAPDPAPAAAQVDPAELARAMAERALMQPMGGVGAVVAPYARSLMALVDAACPGMAGDNLLQDAERVTSAFGAAELAGYFVANEEDGTVVHTQVATEFQADPDVFPLYRRAPMAAVIKTAGQADDDAREDTPGPNREAAAASSAAPAPKPGRGGRRGPRGA